MSVTRYIDANTPTQVNSSLIGVGVHRPAGVIEMDYPWNTATTRRSGSGNNTIISVLFTGETIPYAYTAVAESGQPDGVTPAVDGPTYYNFKFYNIKARDKRSSIWLTVPRNFTDITDTNVYEITEIALPGGTAYMASVIGTVQGFACGSASDTLNQQAGQFLEVENGVFNNLNNGVSGYRFDSNNWYMYDSSDNLYGVCAYGVGSLTGITLSAEEQSESSWEGKVEWKGTPMSGSQPASANYQNISVWTDVENPDVGDSVYYAKNDTEFNVMTITSSVPGVVSCSVEFSVDGTSWTLVTVDGDLTDVNNVIANVPRYVYLRFSQDVEITEE